MKEINNQVQKVSTKDNGAEALEKVLLQGDLTSLSAPERILFYKQLCNSLGLNPLTKPLEYINLQGKLTLYAKRDCTDQLRKINGVSIAITSRERVGDCYIVTAKATDKTGRTDESIGSVLILDKEGKELKGEGFSNAIMKAETKAKRRVTLSICGMGMLDETEVSSIVNVSPTEITATKEAEAEIANQLVTLCKESNLNVKDFTIYHGINSGNPETVIKGVNNFPLLKQQFLEYEAANSNTHPI